MLVVRNYFDGLSKATVITIEVEIKFSEKVNF